MNGMPAQGAASTANAAREQRAIAMKQMVETGPETVGGTLLRKFWHPIALSRNVAVGKALAVRILGEDLALYRGESGTAHLVHNKCAHRLTRLDTGWVQGEEIRCMYHGWKYNAKGECTERPAEKGMSGGNIRIKSYPVREYLGMVFAYMGEGEPPPFELPRKPRFENDQTLTWVREEYWPVNYFQCVENSLDGAHVSFAHQMGVVGLFAKMVTAVVPELKYEETSAGIAQIATRMVDGKPQYRISNWTFPHTNHVRLPTDEEGVWTDSVNYIVPVDDFSTHRFALRAVTKTTPERDAEWMKYMVDCEDWDSSDHHDELFEGKYPIHDPVVRLTPAQDYVAKVGQGTVADRLNEVLGISDQGIALLRRIYQREQDAIRNGAATKGWVRLDKTHDAIQAEKTGDATPSKQNAQV